MVTCETLDHVLSLLSQFGRGALICKTYIEDALFVHLAITSLVSHELPVLSITAVFLWAVLNPVVFLDVCIMLCS